MMILPLTLLLTFAVASEVTVVTVPLGETLTLGITPNGKVELQRIGMVTRVRVEVERARLWTTVGPGLYCYTVWAVSPEGFFENLGELGLDGTNGFIDTSTRFDQLGIIVTAEPHYMVDRPSAHVIYRNQAPRDAAIRRLNVRVETGAYDYSNLRFPPEPRTPSLIFQARAAFQIALNAGADRLAEADLRLARVARDTMEEMLRRAAPFDLLSNIANETIRRSQHALTIARSRNR